MSPGTTGTDTLQFIHSSQLPAGKKATHVRVRADFRKLKKDPYRVRWTVRGDLVDYNGNTSTLTLDLTASILFNSSVILTEGARFIAVDVSDFYLESELEEKEYMWIPVHLLDAETCAAYNLDELIINGRVLTEINKGMYGLPQAGRLVYNNLVLNLDQNGYRPCKQTHGLWRHESSPVTFTLVVDNFGIKYVREEHAKHLIAALLEDYCIIEDWTVCLYCGFATGLGLQERYR